MGVETVAKLSAQARLQLDARKSGKHDFELLPRSRGRGFAMLPAPDEGDLFFDMEGDPVAGEGLEYLFGIYGRLNGAKDPEFRPIWAHSAAEEKAAFESTMRLFVDQIGRLCFSTELGPHPKSGDPIEFLGKLAPCRGPNRRRSGPRQTANLRREFTALAKILGGVPVRCLFTATPSDVERGLTTEDE